MYILICLSALFPLFTLFTLVNLIIIVIIVIVIIPTPLHVFLFSQLKPQPHPHARQPGNPTPRNLIPHDRRNICRNSNSRHGFQHH